MQKNIGSIKLGIKNLFLFSIVTGLGLAIGEYSLKLVGLGDPLIYEANAAYGYALKPDQKKTRLRNAKVTINSSGLRSSTEWASSHNAYKILFLGDSVTYGGSYIDDKELFSELVCKNLGQNFICGNAGVNAYGILNIVLRSRFDSRINCANMVIITIMDSDFYRGINDKNAEHYFINENYSFFPAIAEAVNFIGYKYDINLFIGKRPSSNRYGFEDAAIFAFEQLLAEIDRLEKEGKKVVLLYSPKAAELKGEKSSYGKTLMERSGKKFHDLSDVLNPNTENYYDGVHYEIYGHEVVSKRILSIIKNEKEISEKLNF